MNRQTKQSTATSWVFTFVCIGVVGAVNSVHGQVVIDTDTVIDGENSFPNSGIELIDGINPPTVVDILQGGQIATVSRTVSVVHGSSILNVSGGEVDDIAALDSSMLTVTGGFIGSESGITARNNSTVNVSGGTVYAGEIAAITAADFSTVNITDGRVDGREGAILVRSSAVVNIAGGNIVSEDFTTIEVHGSGKVNISGGQFEKADDDDGEHRGDLIARDSAEVSVTGGTLGSLSARDSAEVSVNGGTLGLSALDSSRFSVLGGNISGIEAFGESVVLLSGGSVGTLWVGGSGIIEVHGSNFSVDDGRLTGILADGSMIDTSTETVGSGQILLVPEPPSIALLLIGLFSGTAVTRRKRGSPIG